MATQQQRQAIEVLLSNYASVLSNADAGKISGFYTSDAVFMPAKGPSIISAEQIGDSAENFFKSQSLSISYIITDIAIEKEFAFVTSQASVSGSHGGHEEIVTRDFFVLRSVSGSWKIFRYIFNA